MNIGIVTTWFERGAAYVSRAYMQSFSLRHNVFIYARGGEATGKGDPVWDLPYVTWAPSYGAIRDGGGYYLNINHFTNWLATKKIDVVFFNEERNHEVVLAAKNHGYTIGSYIDYYTRATVPFFNNYDFLICNTKRHYSVFKNHPKCFYIPWGTDTNLFSVQNKKKNNDITFFHSLGMDYHRKGTDLLLKAFQKVHGNARLIIHGQVPLQDIGLNENEINKSNIEVIIKTVKAPGLYHLGDVYVYPSRLDGIGLTICEALSCGLPVITTDNPPMNEFILDNKNGQVVRIAKEMRRFDNYYWPMVEVDVDDLAYKMQWYVDHPNELKSQALSARKSAEENFCWANNASRLCDFIENINISRVKSKPKLSNKLMWIRDAFGRWLIFNMRKSSLLRSIYKKLKVLCGI